MIALHPQSLVFLSYFIPSSRHRVIHIAAHLHRPACISLLGAQPTVRVHRVNAYASGGGIVFLGAQVYLVRDSLVTPVLFPSFPFGFRVYVCSCGRSVMSRIPPRCPGIASPMSLHHHTTILVAIVPRPSFPLYLYPTFIRSVAPLLYFFPPISRGEARRSGPLLLNQPNHGVPTLFRLFYPPLPVT